MHINNPKLVTVKKDYPGNPYEEGRFHGPYTSTADKGFHKILKWKFSRNPKAAQKRRDDYAVRVMHREGLPEGDGDCLLWLGHATFYIRLGGHRIITDPVFGSIPLVKRLAPLPLYPENLTPDYTLISHGHFTEIGKLFGPIDYALMPIAAYDPPFIMADNHMNPEEAVRACNDMGGKYFIPMHYGTFDLTDEPLGEPLHWLRSIEGKIKGRLKPMDIGEVLSI